MVAHTSGKNESENSDEINHVHEHGGNHASASLRTHLSFLEPGTIALLAENWIHCKHKWKPVKVKDTST